MTASMLLLGPMELVMLFVLGGGLGLPLGMPPAAEDPTISRAAPEECLFYLNWAGMAKPDPASTNQTEQLLAEQEVQAFVAGVENAILGAVRRESANDPQAAALVDSVHLSVKAVLTSPTALYVSRFNASAGPAGLRAGAIVSLGPQAAEVEQALAKIAANTLGEEAMKPAGKGGWKNIPLGEGLVAQWAVKDKWLIVGLGEGEADRVAARLQKEPPAWLTQLRKQLAVPRPASLAYINVAGLLETQSGQLPPDFRKVINALGVDRIQSVACMTGLDESECVGRTQVAWEGEPAGLLAILAAEPLAKEHLAVIPADATLAAAFRLDLAKAYRTIVELVGQIEPRARDELLGGVEEFETGLKFKLSKDVFESVGDVWRVYNSPSEGGLIVTGLTAVVDLRDRDRLVAANGKLLASQLLRGFAEAMADPDRRPDAPAIQQSDFRGQRIFTLGFRGEGVPVAPAWCITDKELIVSLFPQNIRSYLSRPAGAASLADSPAVAPRFGDPERPLAVAYADTPGLFKLFYPIVQMVACAAAGELQREGIDFDAGLLPSASSLLRHMRPAVTTVRRTQAGMMLETRQTLPWSGGGGLLPAVGLFGGISSARPVGPIPTPQNTSVNNLKQLALALHNYHAVFDKFPAAAGSQKPGQPPVSWRVLVLPYVEEQSLYEQYRFDEPWDSDNNRKVAARMPQVFKAPGSQAAAQGKTNYLAVAGKEGCFGVTKGVSIAAITDGTSNTIMLVEVADDKAIPWTKPADFTVDRENPQTGLLGLRPSGFLAAFADGSVQLIPKDTDAATLRAFFTRAGGEVVSRP